MSVPILSSTTDELDARLRAAFDIAGGATPVFPDHALPGSPGFNLRGLARTVLGSTLAEVEDVYRAMNPRLATGAALDGWLRFFGMERVASADATGTLTFTSSFSAVDLVELAGIDTVAANTTIYAGGSPVGLTTEAVQINTTGTVGATFSRGLPAGAPITLGAAHPLRTYVSAALNAPTSTRRNRETDTDARYRLSLRLARRDSPDGLLLALLSDADVSDAEVTPGAFGPGTVRVDVVPATEPPPAGLATRLESLYVGPGKAHVFLPQYEAIAIRIRVPALLEATVQAAVVQYIADLNVGDPFSPAGVERAVLDAGAAAADVVSLNRARLDEDDRTYAAETHSRATLFARTQRAKWTTRTAWVTVCR